MSHVRVRIEVTPAECALIEQALAAFQLQLQRQRVGPTDENRERQDRHTAAVEALLEQFSREVEWPPEHWYVD